MSAPGWRWVPVRPGDKYAITARVDGADTAYTVCRVVVRGVDLFEAWHGQRRLGHWALPDDARAACVAHRQQAALPPDQLFYEGA